MKEKRRLEDGLIISAFIITLLLLFYVQIRIWQLPVEEPLLEPDFTTECSWYSHESAVKEGSLGIMANGQKMTPGYTVASWDYPFGTMLLVSHGGNSVVVEVTDRGPNKRLYASGRRLDLNEAAFRELAPLEVGIIQVDVVEIERGRG